MGKESKEKSQLEEYSSLSLEEVEINELRILIQNLSDKRDLNSQLSCLLKTNMSAQEGVSIEEYSYENPYNSIFKRNKKPPTCTWAFWLMDAEILSDKLSCLEEIYESCLLKQANGNHQKANRLFKWQVFLGVVGYHWNRIKLLLGGIATWFGFPKLAALFKGLL